MKVKIGLIIRALRLAKGIGLNDFADKADVNSSNFSRFERGLTGGLRLEYHLEKIAEVLETRVSALFLLQEKARTDPAMLDDRDRLLQMIERLNKHVGKV